MTDCGNDKALRQADARVHRCGDCGTWCYGQRPCTTCEIAAERVERHHNEQEAS